MKLQFEAASKLNEKELQPAQIMIASVLHKHGAKLDAGTGPASKIKAPSV